MHSGLSIPDADCVVHCGDESNSANAIRNEFECRSFLEWFRALPIENKILVPGNHSTALFAGLVAKHFWDGVWLLDHKEAVINGVRFFGSPWTPRFGNWAYMYKRNRGDVVWSSIPDGIDVLVTHGPPKGILDLTHDCDTRQIIQVGCKSLLNHCIRVSPKIHAFGHIHDEKGLMNQGVYTRGATKFVNCSCCTNAGKLAGNGFVLDLPGDGNKSWHFLSE